MLRYDLVIRNGSILDGTGTVSFVGDVAVRDDVIVAVGAISGRGDDEIDADGMLVTPGFVDIHTHYDGQVIWESRLAPSSGHGVTTVLMGNCGVGFAPCSIDVRGRLISLMEGVEDIPGVVLAEGLTWDWESYPQYLDAVDRRQHDINIASLLPHAPLRVHVMGDRAVAGQLANDREMKEMARLTGEAIKAGALGFSTSRSLFHRSSDGSAIPTLQSGADELLHIARAMEEAGAGILQVGTDYNNFTDIEVEYALIEGVAKATGRSLTLPLAELHAVPGRWRKVMDLIAQSNAYGLEVTCQALPRQVGMLFGLNLTMHPFVLTPSYQEIAQVPMEQRLKQMANPELRARIIAEVPVEGQQAPLQFIRRFEDMYEFADPLDYEPDRSTSIMARAGRMGVSPLDLSYDLLLKHGAKAAFFVPLANYAPGNLDTAYEMFNHPNSVPGLGDGGAHYGVICDASYTTFLITHWTRDRQRGPRLALPEVIRSLTRDTARAIGLHDRGILAPGYRADINIIDYDRLKLHAPEIAFDLPGGGRRLTQRAGGYVATIVNGRIVYRDGKPTGALPGQLVRGPKPAPTRENWPTPSPETA